MKSTREKRLIILGQDLIASIKNAAWVQNGERNLTGPTLHMKCAIDSFEREVLSTCSKCHQLIN